MPRQEAACRGRNDSRARFAFGAWTAVVLWSALAIGWRVTRPESGQSTGLLICLGTTLACALGLSAQLLFHSAIRSLHRQPGELLPFLLTMLPPFVPAVSFLGGLSTFAMIYLVGLFMSTFVAAWGISEAGGFLSLIARPVRETAFPELPGHSAASPAERKQQFTLQEIPAAAPGEQGDKPGIQDDMDGSSEEFEPQNLSPLEARLLRADAAHIGPPEPVIAQWMTRSRSADGDERIEGSVRIEFAPKQKHAVAHISFMPPFERLPAVECHVIDGEGVRVKIGVAQRYGARIEARRSDSGVGPLSLEVGFSAAEPCSRSDAA